MKKLIVTMVAAVLTAVCGEAQLLWRVSGNGAKESSYLFGTHHVAPVALLDSVAGFAEAFGGAEMIVGEIDMAQAESPDAQAVMMKYAMAPADSLLTMVLTPAQADSVNTVMTEYSGGMIGDAVAAMAPLKPAVVMTQIAMLQNVKIFPGFNPAVQLDGTIQSMGREKGKKIVALESLDDQFGLLFGSPISMQANDLMTAVRDDRSGRGMTMARRLADAYMSQNIDSLAAMFADPEVIDSEATARLITVRNEAWLRRLPEIFADGSALVVVGAGHLVGPDGLIVRLRAAGYDVTPVSGHDD